MVQLFAVSWNSLDFELFYLVVALGGGLMIDFSCACEKGIGNDITI